MSEVKYIEVKTILSKLKTTDNLFGITYNMNLYRGCQHGCIYCDTRSDCYRVGDISDISVKENAVELLRWELASKKTKGTIGTGSMNDPYMPIEKELQHTRQALQAIKDFKFPVHVITKSDLVVRDADILQDISKTYAAVSFTITTVDDRLAKRIEPNAPSSTERFKAMEELVKKGIYTGVTLMPVLPFINDMSWNVEAIVRAAKDHGASYVIPMFGMTLRKGSRDYYYKALDAGFPGVRKQYEDLYGDSYECYSLGHRGLNYIFRNLIQKLGMTSEMEFYHTVEHKQLSLF